MRFEIRYFFLEIGSSLKGHFAQKLGWYWVVGVKLSKLGSNYPNFTPNRGKIGVKLVMLLWLGVVLHILIGLRLWLGVSKPNFAHP